MSAHCMPIRQPVTAWVSSLGTKSQISDGMYSLSKCLNAWLVADILLGAGYSKEIPENSSALMELMLEAPGNKKKPAS